MRAGTQDLTRLPARVETLLEISSLLPRSQPLDAPLGNKAEACEHLLKIDESLSGLAAATGRHLLISDPADDPRLMLTHPDPYRRAGYRAFLDVLLELGEQALGVLGARTRREHGFCEDAVLVVELPAAQQPAVDEATSATPAVSVLHEGHILVIDDEEYVAETLRDLLESLGQRVTVALGGASGWEHLTRPGAGYDMVTLDLRMPDLSGPKLWERLKAGGSHFAERVVFVTGDAVNLETDQFLERTGCPVLHKPFGLEDLAALVRTQIPA